MDVLADATLVGIVAGDHRFKRIGPRFVYGSLSAITIALQVVVALMVGLPNLDGSVGEGVASRVEDLSRKAQRHAGISGRAQHVVDWRETFVEGSKRVRRSGLTVLAFVLLKSREHLFGGKPRCN
jgi:hypothetical protein